MLILAYRAQVLLFIIRAVVLFSTAEASVITNSQVVYNLGSGGNVSYLVFDESSLSANPIIYAWHYNGLTNPSTSTRWSGTDLLNAVMAETKGSAIALDYTTGAYGLMTSFTIGSASSVVLNPLTTPVWAYWIKGGSEYEPYGDNAAFTFNAAKTSFIISPNTSDTRWLTNGSYDAWTVSQFSFTGDSGDTSVYTDTSGIKQPVTFGTYAGAEPLSASLIDPTPTPTPQPPQASPQTITLFAPIANRAFSTTSFSITLPKSSSGLPVTVTAGPANRVSINNDTITMRGVGLVTLRAVQSGNANFKPALSANTLFMIIPPRRGGGW